MTEKGKARAGRVSLPKPADPAAQQGELLERPRQVLWIVAALAFTGLMSLITGLLLFGLKGYLLSSAESINKTSSNPQTHAQLVQAVSRQPTAVLIQSVIFIGVLTVVGRAVWRGRHWARWGIIAVWLLSSVTRIIGGVLGILYLFSDAPIAFKLCATLASLAFVVAVVLLVVVKPVVAWLNQTRPVRTGPGSTSAARRGLFTPRQPISVTPAAPAASAPVADRSRSKQRVSPEVALRDETNEGARGPSAARPKARSSKSRRSPS